MNTEITDIRNKRGWVCFDAECALCRAGARRFGPLLARYGFGLVPLQMPWVKEVVGEEHLLDEMRLLSADGRIYGGAWALMAIARGIWWAKPLDWVARVPWVRPALERAYRWVAGHRNCIGGACRSAVRPERIPPGVRMWAPAVALTLGAFLFRGHLPDWVWMWAMALALFVGAKWITVWRFRHLGGKASGVRLLAYALLWPGMDVRAFCGPRRELRPPVREWLLAGANVLLGIVAVWFGVPRTAAAHPLLAGWAGMVGIVCVLHFGLFHMLSLCWRALGIEARPLMRAPAMATSLSRFWGEHWNTAFSDLMHECCFKPLARRVGPAGALGLVFIISGLLHDVMISVPARGGYGLPTLYFALQGGGVLFEHSRAGRRLGLGAGWRGWCFMALVTSLPAIGLFHPVFIHHVILPMLHSLGAN